MGERATNSALDAIERITIVAPAVVAGAISISPLVPLSGPPVLVAVENV
jgi:hypothetical protein